MTYTTRPAIPEDTHAIAPLWQNFLQERAEASPGIAVKSDFDIEQYIAQQLQKPLSFGFILQSQANASLQTVGVLLAYAYDEAPPPTMPEELQNIYQAETPFHSRRIGSVLGLYIQPEHRQPQAIEQLIQVAIAQAEALKVNDIDLLIGSDQTGLQALLQRLGFAQSAVQLVKHYPAVRDFDSSQLPNLHPIHQAETLSQAPSPQAIPLLTTDTNEVVRDSQGNKVWLTPLTTASGNCSIPVKATPSTPCPSEIQKLKTGSLMIRTNWYFLLSYSTIQTT